MTALIIRTYICERKVIAKRVHYRTHCDKCNCLIWHRFKHGPAHCSTCHPAPQRLNVERLNRVKFVPHTSAPAFPRSDRVYEGDT